MRKKKPKPSAARANGSSTPWSSCARTITHAATRERHAQRERLLWDLAERVEAFAVQREALGLRDTRYVLEFYGVPDEVIARVGAKRPETLL